ncbi:MAG: hypothetical protein ACXABY_02215 [Candidatus Thorarchaeota archaeon]|jgi:hypothetical protein
MENIREEMAKWSAQFALGFNKPPETDKLEWALNPNLDTKHLDLDELGQLMFILSSHHFSLAAEMGRVYARMRYDNNDHVSRAKLNIIKPQHDSLEVKISVVKKLFDRKVYAHKRMNNA